MYFSGHRTRNRTSPSEGQATEGHNLVPARTIVEEGMSSQSEPFSPTPSLNVNKVYTITYMYVDRVYTSIHLYAEKVNSICITALNL